MSTSYVPRDGLASRLLQFLRDHPQECPTADDIAARFEANRKNVHTLLAPAVRAGLLARDFDDSTAEYVYRLGTGEVDAPAVAPAAGPSAAPALSNFKGWLAKTGQASAEGRALARKPKPPPQPPAIVLQPTVRYSLFSDGALHIEDGATQIRLTPTDARALVSYLQQVLPVVA